MISDKSSFSGTRNGTAAASPNDGRTPTSALSWPQKIRIRFIFLLVVAMVGIACLHQVTMRAHSPRHRPFLSQSTRKPESGSNRSSQVESRPLVICPEWPPGLLGNNFSVPSRPDAAPSWLELESRLPEVTHGGHKPSNCIARQRIAILVPYRNRESHLRLLLSILHPFLRRQQLHYRIFVIEQVGNSTFNRGMLLNIGFVESRRLFQADCYIFHDVDLLPEHDHNIYRCDLKSPRHMSPSMDKFDYKLLWPNYFGGVSSLTPKQFNAANGFSNLFFGWGGEDDDLGSRCRWAGMSIVRHPFSIARYKMIKHGQDHLNEPNPIRFRLVQEGHARWKQDGLNSLEYSVVGVQDRRLVYTFHVDISEARVQKKFEMSKRSG